MVTTILILGATIFFGRILYGLSAGIGPPTAFSPNFVNMGPIISSVTDVSFFDFLPILPVHFLSPKAYRKILPYTFYPLSFCIRDKRKAPQKWKLNRSCLNQGNEHNS